MIRPTRPTARLTVTTVAIPLVSTVVSLLLLVAWRDELPASIVTHWGLHGSPDGFSSRSGVAWLFAVIGVIAVAAGLFAGRSASSALARTIGATAAGTVVFVNTLLLVSTAAQRGITDPATVSFHGWWIAVGAVAGLLAAALVAVLVPSWRGEAVPEGAPAQAMSLGTGERVVWSAAVTSGRAGTVVLAAAVAITVALAVVTRLWWLLAVPALLALTMAAMLSIRVTVDPTGLHVRGRFGWPRTTLALDRISSVSTVEVNALRDFGGWGYRFAATGRYKGARGFILHSGPAILVTTTDGRNEITVVDDAATGAALLETYRSRTTT